MDRGELLWSIYLSEREFIRHHEQQRTTASNILGAIAAGLVVALGSGELSPQANLAVSIVMVFLGLFGIFFSCKLSELIKMHTKRSYAFLDELDAEFSDIGINDKRDAVKAAHKKDYPFFSGKRLSHVWIWFHGAILFAGAAMLLTTLLNLQG